MTTSKEKEYWTNRYKEQKTGWDLGFPSTPLKEYINQLTDKNVKVLIPGAGNAYEAEYLLHEGFKQVYILDISEEPLKEFKERNPSFPENQLICENFFEHHGQYDLIIEQTFFCSFIPLEENRNAYSLKMSQLLKEKGKLVGLWFDFPITSDLEKRPFGGDKETYLSYLTPYFDVKCFEKCYNSIPNREELFGIFLKN